MLQFGESKTMGKAGLEYFLRFSMVLFFMSLMMLIIVEKGSKEYMLTLVSAGISGALSGVLTILLKAHKNR